MSRVTSAFLIVQEYGEVTKEMLRKELAPAQGFKMMPEELDTWSGGYKGVEVDLWAAGFNYIDGRDVEAWFFKLPWGEYGQAYLVWECNGELSGFGSVNWVDQPGL